jgi:hypothetical protein
MDCELCRNRFNYNDFKPIVLWPCSHTFCCKCIETWPDRLYIFIFTDITIYIYKIINLSNNVLL